MTLQNSLGATYLGDNRYRFLVWAPKRERVDVHVLAPLEQIVALEPKRRGYFEGTIENVAPGSTYRYRLDGDVERPDPASKHQPEGVHGPSQVIDPSAFEWTDRGWTGVRQEDLVLYELHVGTFTPEGTFDAIISHLDDLRDLGVTAIELMPVAQFPGERNWGYDGGYLYGVQNSYGGPEGLRRLVNACHVRGLAVILDVVYNHLGPEGNYLNEYGQYFTDRYHTPWGDAINLDGPHSDEVRRFFIENALYWVRDYHLDGFRLDATDRIIDESATHFLKALTTAVHELSGRLGRRVWMIAESDANDVTWILPSQLGGYGLDAQWGDDFHHALHALLTGESSGYYRDFGTIWHLAKVFSQVFYYDGVYSHHRQRTHGNSPRPAQARQFVVAAQNHDQVGNRASGERMGQLVSHESAKLAAATYLLSPYIPLIFMGEEYAEDAPFQYFTSHTDPVLAANVSNGRTEEFEAYVGARDVPDPQDEATFQRSKLNHGLRHAGQHRAMYAWYRELLRCRRELEALCNLNKDAMEVTVLDAQLLFVRRWSDSNNEEVAMAFNFSESDASVQRLIPPGTWRKVIASSDPEWGGSGNSIPETIADGQMNATLPGRSMLLLERET